jgi:hypothetical protein
MKGLGEDKVRVLSYPDDQRVWGQNGLDEVYRLLDTIVGGDEGDVDIATVMNKAGQSVIRSRMAARSGWMCIGMEKHMTDVSFEQRGAVCGTDVQGVIRKRRGF